jgi:hypothetical protein
MSEFHFGIPREDWLRVIVNRVDPTCFGLFRSLGRSGRFWRSFYARQVAGI